MAECKDIVFCALDEGHGLTFMGHVGYEACRGWLRGVLWQDILQRKRPPQHGEEAVKAFGPKLVAPAREEFVKGWNRCLFEHGDTCCKYYPRALLNAPKETLSKGRPFTSLLSLSKDR